MRKSVANSINYLSFTGNSMEGNVEQRAKGNVGGIIFGILALLFGITSIFIFAPVFVPLAVIFSIAAIFSRQLLLGFTGLGTAFIGFITSPILMGLFAITSLTTIFALHNSNSGSSGNSGSSESTQNQQTGINEKLANLTRQVSFKKCAPPDNCVYFYDFYEAHPGFAKKIKSEINKSNQRMPSWIPYGVGDPLMSGYIENKSATIGSIGESQNLSHHLDAIFYSDSQRFVGLYMPYDDPNKAFWLGDPSRTEKATLIAYERNPSLIEK